MSEELDDKELKIAALLERMADVTKESESRIADLRVALTKVHHEFGEYMRKHQEANSVATDEVGHAPPFGGGVPPENATDWESPQHTGDDVVASEVMEEE